MDYRLDTDVLVSTVSHGRPVSEFRARQVVFSQGDAADCVFFIVGGSVKIVVTSKQGKEAVVACSGRRFLRRRLPDRPAVPLATATAMTRAR